MLIHINDLLLDRTGEVIGRHRVVTGQDDGKFLAAVPGGNTILPDTGSDDPRDTLQCEVALHIAVKLVIELEIVDIEDHERKRTVTAAFELLVQFFVEEFAVQKPGEIVDAGFIVSFFIELRVFDGDGNDRVDRFQEGYVVKGVIVVLILFGKAQDADQLLVADERYETFDVQIAQLPLLAFPHRFIRYGAGKFLEDETVFLLAHPPHAGVGKRDCKAVGVEWTG